MTAIDKVRSMVDRRIAALEERRAKRSGASGMAHSRASFELTEVGSESRASYSCSLSHIDIGKVFEKRRMRSGDSRARLMRKVRFLDDLLVPPVESRPPNLKAANLSFAARLILAIRDRFGGDAPKVYTAAKVSRQVYSQIITDETRPVSKRTAIRFAFALKMTPDEAKLLLKSAGYAFSNSQTEDFILQACLEVDPPIWDLDAVNQLLKEYRVDFQY